MSVVAKLVTLLGTRDGEYPCVYILCPRLDRMQSKLSSHEYEDLLAQSVDIITVLDDSGTVKYQSPSATSRLGYAPDELVGDHVFEYVHPDDRAAAVEAFQRVVETAGNDPASADDTTETVQHRFKHADGSWLWLESRASTHQANDLDGYVITSRDISALKQREAELERTRDLLEKTEQIADVGGWELDTDTQAVYWTDHLFELLQWEDDDEPPLDEALDVYHEDDRPRVETAVNQALAAGEPFDVEARFYRTDSSLRWFHIQGKPTVENGDVVTLRGTVQDITEHKQREQELQRYQTIVEASGDPVYTVDETGQFTSVNDALVALTGYAEETLLGSHASLVLPSDHVERGQSVIESLLGTDAERQTVEMDIITAAGERVPCENHIALLPFDEEFRGTVGVLRDISERVERERQLKRERDRLDEFASIVSHDLRNPLNVAQGRIELAQAECASEHLADAAQAVDRSLALVDDVLTLAREGTQIGETELVDLAELTEACWQTVNTSGASLVVESAPTVQADRSRLRQVIENLLRNAVEHGGESVTIRVGGKGDGFYVEDDGSGIPAEKRERVFEAGYSTNEEGTGFGLNIVREIAEAHGWTVTAKESATGGARVEITGVRMSSE